jgi:hypothetical protein
MRLAQQSSWLSPLHRNWRAYLVMNALFYGTYLLGMSAVVLDPQLQDGLNNQIQRELRGGPMAVVARAYRSGNLPVAILLTFTINLVIGSVVMINLPSAVIPFAGIATGLWRAALWGVMLSPVDPQRRLALLPHHLNSVLEGQAYVLAMLAAYLQARWAIPAAADHRGETWGDGLLQTFQLYRLIVPMLAVAAVYEAIEVIYVVPLLK